MDSMRGGNEPPANITANSENDMTTKFETGRTYWTRSDAVKDLQRKFAKGECAKEEMIAAQRAYALELNKDERESERLARESEKELQESIWQSIRDSDYPRIHKMAVELDCVRGSLYVPNTGHWANWRDADAICYHGVSLEQLCERFLALSGECWDGTYEHLWEFTRG